MHILHIGTKTAVGQWDALYAKYVYEIMEHGQQFVGRNGLTRSVFGSSVTVDLNAGFPLTRLRKMPIQNLFREFLFDIGFCQNVEALGPAKHFWDFLADENGDLGASAYNRQWRMWPGSAVGSEVANERLSYSRVDQLQRVINTLRKTPNSRHATAITLNPTAIDPACPPCHIGLQFNPNPDGTLSLMVPARSNDMIVGFPLDIARYAILTEVVAKAVDMKPGKVYMPSANSHIYENCFELAAELQRREAMPECRLLISPEWDARAEKPLDDLKLEHLGVSNYEAHAAIKVSVN